MGKRATCKKHSKIRTARMDERGAQAGQWGRAAKLGETQPGGGSGAECVDGLTGRVSLHEQKSQEHFTEAWVEKAGGGSLEGVRQHVQARPMSMSDGACSSAGAPPRPWRELWARCRRPERLQQVAAEEGIHIAHPQRVPGSPTLARCVLRPPLPVFQDPVRTTTTVLRLPVSCVCGGDPERFRRLVPACRPHCAHCISAPPSHLVPSRTLPSPVIAAPRDRSSSSSSAIPRLRLQPALSLSFFLSHHPTVCGNASVPRARSAVRAL